MVITVKTTKKTVIGLLILILASSLSWAGNVVFTDYPARALKVLELNEEAQTVVLESPDGVTATLTVGDVVGQESAMIIEIKKLVIILEGTPDETGRTRKSCIPVIPIGSPVPLVAQ
ncbi:MAG: hypothetical protein ACNYWU_09355 [Desulfobacterales bacterium]